MVQKSRTVSLNSSRMSNTTSHWATVLVLAGIDLFFFLAGQRGGGCRLHFLHLSFGLSRYSSWRMGWFSSARCPPHLYRTSVSAWSFPDCIWKSLGSALCAWGGVGFWETKPCSPWEGIERFGAEILLLFTCTHVSRGRKYKVFEV